MRCSQATELKIILGVVEFLMGEVVLGANSNYHTVTSLQLQVSHSAESGEAK